MAQAVLLGGGTPMVRVPWNEPGIIGKSLDAGAYGVIVPMVNSREEAEAVVRSARYVPDGSRSWGPVLAGMRHSDNRGWAGEHVAVIPMIETGDAIANLDEILSVPGVDAIYVGPADLSLTLGCTPKLDQTEAPVVEALGKILAACKPGVVPGSTPPAR
jgi:4-hydroxy-2-oxoheptanedioate aldolase